jgi:hypothetical protein
MSPGEEQLVELYRQLSDLTRPECAACRVPNSCCGAEYCREAERWAQEKWGVTLARTGHPRLPFMGPAGCTVLPHLRPICTRHTCEVNSLGCKRGDLKWTERYFDLCQQIDEMEMELHPF